MLQNITLARFLRIFELLMMNSAFVPPYDSPLEEIFAYHVSKYFDSELYFSPQFRVNTICGLFIVDFVAVTHLGRRIGFECDGKEFHDSSRDEWRDAMILGADGLDVIYRLRGEDLTYRMNDVLYILSRLEPDLFSERGRLNLHMLVSLATREIVLERDASTFALVLQDDNLDGIQRVWIERRFKEVPLGQRQFWQSAYAFACSVGGGNLDGVIASYRAN